MLGQLGRAQRGAGGLLRCPSRGAATGASSRRGATCAAWQHGSSSPLARAITADSASSAWPSQQQAVDSGGAGSSWRLATHSSSSSSGRRRRLVIAAAMFDNLSASLQSALKSLKPGAKLTPENIKEPLRDIRRALLEADVSLPVVRRFVKRVEAAAQGVEVIAGVTPQVQFVKVVNDQLVELMGSAGSKDLAPGAPQVVLMAGLQGVGKTTACGKLALFLQRRQKKVMMVATDVHRPAAIDQLVKLGAKIDVPVFELGTSAAPVDIARAGVAAAAAAGCDAVIIDTAGRLQVDERLMDELVSIKAAVQPTDTLLVVDAMTGQEAAALVKTFDAAVDLSGAVLTKMDGDARGGAALSVRDVSGKPIKFVGTGERLEALEPFYPERMAQRVLGMGDVLTLYEKAADAIKQEEVEAFQARMNANKFDFNDFVSNWRRVNNMGGLSMMKMLPGMGSVSEKQLYALEKKLKGYEAMIASMTEDERTTPELLIKSPSRRRRIAQGAGRTDAEVQELLAAFGQMKSQMGMMSRMMRLSGGGGGDEAALMQELVKSSQAGVAPGKVRRRKEAMPRPRDAKDKSRGFARA